MNQIAEDLRELLEVRDLDGFLEHYAAYRERPALDADVTALTQRVFPPVLREALGADRLLPSSLVLLYQLVQSGRLLLMENDLLVGINLRIDAAMREVDAAARVPVQPLITFQDVEPLKARRSPSGTNTLSVEATQVHRVALVSAFTVSTWLSVDAFDCRRNVCASRQEKEFLQAVRQYFPSLYAYPNVPLKNFIDIERLGTKLPSRVRSYAWLAQVDVLLCTHDEDPVAGIELDSVHHDTEVASQRDEMKNTLFQLARLPLVRIRSSNESTVRAENFYELLQAESSILDNLRPRSLRPRRTHDSLVPAESVSRIRMVDTA